MADKSQKAAEAVERLFKRKPGADLDEFIQVAAQADSSIDTDMDKRSFNAIYVLPLKRKASSGKKKKKKTGGRKKRTRRSSTKKTGRRGGPTAAGRAAARELILGRDQKVIDTMSGDTDPRQAYDLGAEVDRYIDDLYAALKG